MTDGADIAKKAVAMFKPGMLAGMTAEVEKMAAELRKLPLGDICNFEDYLSRTGAPKTATGPDIQALWSKSPMHAAVAKQHRPSVAQGSQDRMIHRGVGPDEHVMQARVLEHPFAAAVPLEHDLRFAVEANVRIGLNIKKHRRRRMRIIERIPEATQTIDDKLRKARPVALVGMRGPSPMFVAVMIAIMKWPDVDLPSRLTEGFEIARDIGKSNIFRPSSPRKVSGPTTGTWNGAHSAICSCVCG